MAILPTLLWGLTLCLLVLVWFAWNQFEDPHEAALGQALQQVKDMRMNIVPILSNKATHAPVDFFSVRLRPNTSQPTRLPTRNPSPLFVFDDYFAENTTTTTDEISIHLDFSLKLHALMTTYNTSRVISFYKLFHFNSGKEQAKRYFKSLQLPPRIVYVSNATQFVPFSLIMAPCTSRLNLTGYSTETTTSLVSYFPLDFTLKKLLFHLLPSSCFVSRETQCSSSSSSPRVYFTKTEDFATFARPSDTCIKHSSFLPFQNDDSGGYYQARCFLLIANLSPLSAWFQLGYMFRDNKLVPFHASKSIVSKVKRHTYLVFATLRPTLEAWKQGSNTKGFSLLNVDFLVHEPTNQIRIVEMGCNGEVFNNERHVGEALVRKSTQLMESMMDLVLLAHDRADVFGRMVTELSPTKLREEVEVDGGVWELLYSSLLRPEFHFVLDQNPICENERHNNSTVTP